MRSRMALPPPRLSWQPDVPMNPASVMKLVTTYAGVDQLGPGLQKPGGIGVSELVRGDGLIDPGLLDQPFQIVAHCAWVGRRFAGPFAEDVIPQLQALTDPGAEFLPEVDG